MRRKKIDQGKQNMKVKTGGSSVTINGQTFSGRSISIVGDRIVIDGAEVGDSLVGPISVVVNGNADSVETTAGSVEVTGAVGWIKTMSGDVHCSDVTGDVGTMSGDVICQKIAGNAKTMSGDIKGLGR